MRNVNELIGIINGINNDGIIDEREISLLQSWVAQNRNLVFEPNQVALLNKVETLVLDGIVSDEERNELISLADSFAVGDSVEIGYIYELSSIFDEIVCDQQMDRDVHQRLQKWVFDYAPICRKKGFSAHFFIILDEILDTGIASSLSHEEIITVLDEHKKAVLLEAKINQLCRLVSEKKSIGIELIDILDNEDAIGEINKRAEEWLKKGLQSYSGTIMHSDLIFVSLVLIAMLKYDGNYYEYVRETYKNLYNGYFTEQKIEGTIRTILRRYNFSGIDIYMGARVINSALSDAIVPLHYLPAFFEFIYDIYKLNFDCDLPDNLYDEFGFIYDGLQSVMSSDSDEVSLSVTQKSYKLIRSTKRLIANDQKDSIIKLSIIVVNLIDKKVWDKDNKIFNPYLKAGYEGWIKTLKEDVRSGRRDRATGELRSKWEPEFRLIDRAIYLDPPVHKVKSIYNPYEIYAIVQCDGKTVAEQKTPYVAEIIGGYKVIVDKILLESPLAHVRYMLVAGNECIYDSKEKLYCECIVFDPSGEEIENNTNYSGGAVLCHSGADDRFESYCRSRYYSLSFLNVKEGMSLMVGETLLNFSRFAKPGIFGSVYENAFLREMESAELIPIYKEISCVYFESNSKTANYEIVINERHYKLSDFEINRTETDRGNKYVVNLNVSKTGIFNIKVSQIEAGKKQKLFEDTVAVDNKLDWSTEQIEETRYYLMVESELAALSLYEEIDVCQYDEERLTFDWGGNEYCLLLPLELNIYRLIGGNWMPYSKCLWIGDINTESQIEFLGTSIKNVEVRGSNGVCIDEDIPVKRSGSVEKIDVGFLLTHKSEYDYVVLAFTQESKPVNAVFCYNKCVFDESSTEISYSAENGLLSVIPKYNGKGNIFYRVEDKFGNEIYASGYVESDMPDYSHNLRLFEHYRFKFFSKEKGLSLKKETLLATIDKVFYSIDAFVGRSFRIDEVYFDQFANGVFTRKNWHMKKVYLYFTKQIDEGMFEGELYTRTARGNYMLNRVNPVTIEVCGEIVDETLELSITKDGDGLFLDFEHSGLKNTLYDPTAVDIFSYIIDVNGVETA